MKRPYTLLGVLPAILFVVSVFLVSPARADTNVSGDITTDTSWGGDTYIVQGRVTVDNGVTLTIDAGTLVKFDNGPIGITVASGGMLKVNGTAANTVTLTADTASPTAGYWDTIKISSGASSTITNATVLYGGYSGFGHIGNEAAFYVNGGNLTLDTVEVSSSKTNAIYQDAGTITVTGCNIHGQTSSFGIDQEGGNLSVLSSNIHDNASGIEGSSSGALTLTGNTFADTGYPAQIYLSFGTTFTHSGNTSSGSGTHGYYVFGTLNSSQTWSGDGIPTIADGITVPSGKVLTVRDGAVLKLGNASSITVNSGGILDAQGTSASSIYFTTLSDDGADVGGDTENNGDAGGNAPGGSTNRWRAIKLDSGASSTIAYAVLRYGGRNGLEAEIYNDGGTLTVATSIMASSVSYSIYQDAGTSAISGSDIHNQSSNYGVGIDGGTANISSSNIHGNATGIYIGGGTVIVSDTEVATSTSYGVYQGSGASAITLSDIRDTSHGLELAGGTMYVSKSGIYNATRGFSVSGGTLAVAGSEIHDNNYGIYVTGGSVSATSNLFKANSVFGVYSSSPSVDAEYNYWDDSTGPYNSTNNPSGTGNEVSDPVVFDPFNTQDHYLSSLGDGVDGNVIEWTGSTTVTDAFTAAVNTWNAEGKINIYYVSSSPDITVSDIDDDQVDWAGNYNYAYHTLQFNKAHLRGIDPLIQQNAATHELGHALGLDHSYVGDLPPIFSPGIMRLSPVSVRPTRLSA